MRNDLMFAFQYSGQLFWEFIGLCLGWHRFLIRNKDGAYEVVCARDEGKARKSSDVQLVARLS